MSIYTNRYAQKVYEIIEPLVGTYMAKAVLKTQCSKMGVNEENLTVKDMAGLADGIQTGLKVFLGSDMSAKICETISQIK